MNSIAKEIARRPGRFPRTDEIGVRENTLLRMPSSFARMGQARKIRLLKSAGVAPNVMGMFIKDVDPANFPKLVKGSLHGVDSAFRRPTAFFAIRKVPLSLFLMRSFPIWSAFSARWRLSVTTLPCRKDDGSSFDTLHPGNPVCVSRGARGLEKCQRRIRRFHNFAHIPLLLRIIGREFPWKRIRTGGILSLFPHEVSSIDTIISPGVLLGPLATFSRQPERAPTGDRFPCDAHFVFAKFTWRTNLVSGCILRRPCFCHLPNRRAASIFSVRALRTLIRSRVAPRRPILSSVARRNFNRILHSVTIKLQIPDSHRYRPRGFRRVSSHGSRTRPPWAAVVASGVWHSDAFRCCDALSRDEDLGAHQLFDGDIDSESDPDWAGTTLGYLLGGTTDRSVATDCPRVSGFSRIDRYELVDTMGLPRVVNGPISYLRWATSVIATALIPRRPSSKKTIRSLVAFGPAPADETS